MRGVKEISVNQSVFDGLGCLKNFEYDFVENPSFGIHPARRTLHTYRQMMADELDNMAKQKVIHEVAAATPAVSLMVVVKQQGRIRICINLTWIQPRKVAVWVVLSAVDLPTNYDEVAARYNEG